MTDRATQAENRLKDAQKALKDAQDNLAANSGSLGSAFKNLGAAIVQPVSGAFGRVKTRQRRRSPASPRKPATA